MECLFSIITINYNNLEGLKSTFNSVINQNFERYEYIIIDGKSDDGSNDFLNTINSDELVSVVSEQDKGIYDAMNKGIASSIGKYVIFMNSGDCFAHNEILQELTLKIERLDSYPKYIYGDTYEKELISKKLHYKKAKNHGKYWYGMFAHHQSMVFSNDIIKENKLTFNLNYALSADWDFVLRFLRLIKEEDIVYSNNVISIFELGGFSSNFVKGIKEQYSIRRKTLRWNFFSCLTIASLHYLLNIIRRNMPFIYNYYISFRSK
jgi:putative colanic acid biosynthesis glycosyltransferase